MDQIVGEHLGVGLGQLHFSYLSVTEAESLEEGLVEQAADIIRRLSIRLRGISSAGQRLLDVVPIALGSSFSGDDCAVGSLDGFRQTGLLAVQHVQWHGSGKVRLDELRPFVVELDDLPLGSLGFLLDLLVALVEPGKKFRLDCFGPPG